VRIARYHADMGGLPPTVVGALIAGGAALIGFGASAWNTSRTVRASRAAVRDQRLWEKRSAVYEDIAAAMFILTSNREDPERVDKFDRDLTGLVVAVQMYASEQVRDDFNELLGWVQRIRTEKDLDDPSRDMFTSQLSRTYETIRGEVQGDPPPLNLRLIRRRVRARLGL